MKIIEVTISPQGEIEIEAKGFTGAECQQASQFLEQALGQRQAEQLTAEYHAQADQFQHQQSQN